MRKLILDDIAKELNVSKSTVSRAISGKGRIGLSTKAKILEYVEKVHYSPNTIAKGLAESKSNNIGLILRGDNTELDFCSFQDFVKGITETTSEMGYDILMSLISENEPLNMISMIENRKVDGIILYGTQFSVNVVEYLKNSGIPFVMAGASPYNDVLNIDYNHREASKELTTMLILLGLKKIALIGGNRKLAINQCRLNGYEDAIREQMIDIQRDLIYMDLKSSVKAESIVKNLLDKKVDCIMCMDEVVCEKVLFILRKNNVNIPKDIKIACYGNSKILMYNNITCLQFDSRKLGILAMGALLNYINNEEAEKSYPLEYEIRLKESTKIQNK